MRTVLTFLAVAALCPPHVLHAQQGATPPNNGIYLELAGNGGLFSINYERNVAGLRARIGFASWGTEGGSLLDSTWSRTYVTVPMTVSRVRGSRTTGWEAGGGLLVGQKKYTHSAPELSDDEPSRIVDLTGILGYRWIREGGWLVRVTFTPFLTLVGDYPTEGVFPSVGLSVGRAF